MLNCKNMYIRCTVQDISEPYPHRNKYIKLIYIKNLSIYRKRSVKFAHEAVPMCWKHIPRKKVLDP